MRHCRPWLLVVSAWFALSASVMVVGGEAFSASWQGVRAPLPAGAAWAASCAYGGRVYLFGGTASSPEQVSLTLSATQVYDPASDTWRRGADLPTPRYLATVAEVGGRIYVMGGRDTDAAGNGTAKDANEAYDPAADSWSTRRALPVAMRGHACAVAGGRIYLFGGRSSDYERAVRIYDPASDSWSAGEDMPGPRAYGAAVYIPSKGRIYVIGGEKAGDLPDRYLGDVVAYDPLADRWDAGSVPMLEAVSNFACALDPGSGRVYLFSGSAWDEAANADGGSCFRTQVLESATMAFSRGPLPPSPLARQEASAALVDGTIYLMGGRYAPRLVDALNPSTGLWYQPLAPLPRLGDNPSLVALGGKLYLLGGVSATDYNSSAYAYDPAANTWTTGQAVISLARYGAVAAAWNGKIVISGGTARLFTYTFVTDDTQLYDPATDSFTLLTPAPEPATLACGAVLGGVLYTFGGYSGLEDLASTRALDLATGAWSTRASLPAPLEQASAAALAGKVYICGGIDGSTGRLSERVLVYDPATNSFASGAAMPIPVYRAAAATYQNLILVYGGDTLYQSQGNTYRRPSPFLQVYDPGADAWTTFDGLYARSSHAAAVLEGKLYTTGGDDGSFLADRLDVASLSGSVPPPAVASMAKLGNPFRIDVRGSNLQSGIRVFIGGSEWPSSLIKWKSTGQLLVKGGAALKSAVPKNASTPFLFRNPDGGEAAVSFTWP